MKYFFNFSFLLLLCLECINLKAQPQPDRPEGRFLKLDGVDDFMHLSQWAEDLIFPAPVTFEFWLRADFDHKTDGGGIWCINDGKPLLDPDGESFELRYGSNTSGLQNEVLTIFYSRGNSTNTVGFGVEDSASYINEWHHYAVIADGDTYKVYIDGTERILKQSTQTSGTIKNYGAGVDPKLNVGMGNRCFDTAPFYGFGGFIDEFRIWNKIRSQSQILSTMNDTLSAAYYNTSDSGLVGYWRLDELNDTSDYSIYRQYGHLLWGAKVTLDYEDWPNAPSELTADPLSGTEIMLTWKDNSDIESEFEILRSTSGFIFSTIGNVDTNITTFTDQDASPNVEYCYKVFAKRIAYRNSDTSEVACTTISPPSAPTGLISNALGTTDIWLAWIDNSSDEDGFEIQRSDDGGNSFFAIDSVMNDTSYINSGLDPGTEYRYKVRAFSSGGPSGFSNDVTVVTHLYAPTVLKAYVLNESSIKLTWLDNSNNEESFKIQRKRSRDPNSTYNQVGTVGENVTVFVDSDLPTSPDSAYCYRVFAYLSDPLSSSDSVVTCANLEITLVQTISFPVKTNPDEYTSTDYKIIGIPGNSGLSVSELLTGTQGTDWEVYNDNGQPTNYYDKFKNSTPFLYNTGKAYWIIQKGNLNINTVVTPAYFDVSGFVEIELQSGFNLITNPFREPVQWLDVLTLNGLNQSTPLQMYNNGWMSSNNLQAFVGYLFENSTGLNNLQIPAPSGGQPVPKQNDTDLWRVGIDLISGSFVDMTTSFGITTHALVGYDQSDFKKPRSLGFTPTVYFFHPEWDNGNGLFATDMRPPFGELEVWEFKVSSQLGDTVHLKFDGMNRISEQMEIYLIDENLAQYINLRHQSSYKFVSATKISDFQIAVGKKEILNLLLNNLLPTEFELGNNFPNPFNPSTTFQVSIPTSSEIRLIIYDILGQEIKELFEGALNPGRYWYQWDGKNDEGLVVPSGLYIYNITDNTGINISKKMILLK